MLCRAEVVWLASGGGSAGIRQERSGRYSAAYVGPDTKLHKAPRTYATESDAEGWLALERRKIDLGTWGAIERSDGITLRAYADQWIEQRQPARPDTRSTTSRCSSGSSCPTSATRRSSR